MRKVVEQVVDDKRFLEIFPSYAENVVIGFARLDGYEAVDPAVQARPHGVH